MREVRAAIQRGLAHSPLTDMPAHTRDLERAYFAALRQRRPMRWRAAEATGDG